MRVRWGLIAVSVWVGFGILLCFLAWWQTSLIDMGINLGLHVN